MNEDEWHCWFFINLLTKHVDGSSRNEGLEPTKCQITNIFLNDSLKNSRLLEKDERPTLLCLIVGGGVLTIQSFTKLYYNHQFHFGKHYLKSRENQFPDARHSMIENSSHLLSKQMLFFTIIYLKPIFFCVFLRTK